MNVDALITLVILLAFLVLTVTARLAVDIALAAAMIGCCINPGRDSKALLIPLFVAFYTIVCFYIVSAVRDRISVSLKLDR